MWLGGWDFSTTGGQWFNQKCPLNRTFIITPKRWVSESSWVGEHMKALGGWCALRGRGSSASLYSIPCPSISSILLFLSGILYTKPVRVKYFLSWVLWVISAIIIIIFKIYLFLFSYNCLHFLPFPPPHPSQSHLPSPPLPSPLILSLCPL